MAVRGDEVAERIEAKIRESVNRMMQEVRTTIGDVREAIEQQLEAAVQSVQADVNAFAFRAHLDEGINELVESYEQKLREKPLPAAGAGSDVVKQSLRGIEAGKNQVEILSALLDETAKYGSRAALMILKGDSFAGWKGAGFSSHGGNDESIKRFSAARESAPQFDQLLREERTIVWDGQNLASRFGVTPSARAALVPMVIKDKVAAAVYVDAVTDDVAKFDQSAIEMLVFATGLLIDTLAIRKKVPSPTLSAAARTLPAPLPEPKAEAAPEPASETIAVRLPHVTPAAVKADDTAPGAPTPAEPAMTAPQPMLQQPASAAPSRTFELQTEPPAEKSWPHPSAPDEPEVENGFATAMFPMMPSPAAKPEPQAPPVSAPTPVSELAERATTQYIPPPGLTRGSGFVVKTDADKKHEEARRFARLLVSEIKLYNESQVEQGRRDKDLYERLKEDIDRSRQMYDDRIPDDVRKGTNYFYEELVRILADGNREALGL
jgi:hypothetical protein